MGERVHVFSNGTQYMDFDEYNCCRCARDPWGQITDANGEYNGKHADCELFEAIEDASFSGDGFAPDIAKRLGYDAEQVPYLWRCGEFAERRLAELDALWTELEGQR